MAMTQSVSAAEVRAAGGFRQWAEKAARAPARQSHSAAYPGPGMESPAQAYSPKRKEAKVANLRNLATLPAAKGRRPKNRLVGYDAERMNKTEEKYAELLETQRRAGKILFWRYESVKFRLADRTWYTPDFYIMRPDGTIEIHETKGWMEEDANVKIKTTAEQFPEFVFVLVTWDKKLKDWLSRRYR